MPTPRKTTAKKATPAEEVKKKKPAAVKPAARKAGTTRAKKATQPVPPRPSNDGPKVSPIAAKRARARGSDDPGLDPYAPTVWGAEDNSGSLVDLVLPSGQTILAQRPGPQGLMAAGMLDDLDTLSSILPKIMGGVTAKGQAPKEFDASVIMKNPAMLSQAMKLMDRVLVHVVIKPELTPEPDSPTDRERGKIYPSSVGQEDKAFIFNWAVGGTQDLSRFRSEYEESVAGLEPGADVVDQA